MGAKDENDKLRGGELGDVEDGLEPMPGGGPVLTSADPFGPLWKPLGVALPDLFTKTLTPPRWLLEREGKGVLRLGKVGLFVAAGGVGKTQALVQLAVSVAINATSAADRAATRWFDTFQVVQPGRVLLALAEEDEDEVVRRIRSAAGLLGLTAAQRADVLANVVALPLAGTPVGLVKHDPIERVTALTATLAALQAKLAESDGWSLIVLDPLSRWAGPDSETDNAAATKFIEAVETLVRAPGGPAVLVAHHTPKASRDSKSGVATASARGASALTDGARWVATLVPQDDLDEAPTDVVAFEIVKSNYAARGKPLLLRREEAHSGALRRMTDGEQESYAISLRDAQGGRGNKGKTKPALGASGKPDFSDS